MSGGLSAPPAKKSSLGISATPGGCAQPTASSRRSLGPEAPVLCTGAARAGPSFWEPSMFFHRKQLQYHARPERPDPLFAKMLQEPLGGQWGEISVMMNYLFQGWNCRGPQKYKDMILDIGTEEIGHVEMLATMIARLLETSPVEQQEDMAKNSLLGAVMGGARIEDAIVGGMNPQHVIVSGLGATPTDSVGFPWNSPVHDREWQSSRRLPLQCDGREPGPAAGQPSL